MHVPTDIGYESLTKEKVFFLIYPDNCASWDLESFLLIPFVTNFERKASFDVSLLTWSIKWHACYKPSSIDIFQKRV